MRDKTIRITVELTGSDFDAIERAAQRIGNSPAEYVRYAALRLASRDAALDRLEQGSTGERSPSPPRRSLRAVNRRTPVPTVELVRQLEAHLGAQLLAITVGTNAYEVQSWASEDNEPSPMQERRLREAHEAWQLVVSVESPETTRAWWMGMKGELDDLSPAEAIALDRGRAVMSVARAFIESG